MNKTTFKRRQVARYYSLTKPGIIYGNLLSAAGGFLYASQGTIDIILFLLTLTGTGLIIASACVFNNYIDRDTDAKMERTHNRPLVNGEIAYSHALLFGSTLGILGTGILAVLINTATLVLGVIGFVSYIFIYTPLKRRTVHSTLIGSISGATPIAAGYTGVTGHFDSTALLLFLILAVWQLPHFYAIAMFRQKEYRAAGLPILTVVYGNARAKNQIVFYTLLFLALTLGFAYIERLSYSFWIVMTGLAAYWCGLGIYKSSSASGDTWARKMFGTSLIVLMGFCALLSAEFWLR